MEIVHNVDFLTNAAFNLAILHFVWRGQAGLEKFLNIKPIKAARTTQFKVSSLETKMLHLIQLIV